MIIKVLFGGMLIATLFSCSQNEQSHEEKIRETVETYLDEMLRNEPITAFTVDSIEINNISPKTVLQLEVNEYLKQLQDKSEEAKALKLEVQEALDLKLLYDDVTGGEKDDFSSSNNKSLEEKRLEFKKLKDDCDTLLKIAELKTQELENADSTSVSYYEVIAKGKITTKSNVEKSAIYPFHISKEYVILKEPLELLKVR